MPSALAFAWTVGFGLPTLRQLRAAEAKRQNQNTADRIPDDGPCILASLRQAETKTGGST